MGFVLALAAVVLVTPALAILALWHRALPLLRNTYIFWALLSFSNPSLLAGLAVPPMLLFFFDGFYDRFVLFLALPALLALLMASMCTLALGMEVPWFRSTALGRECRSLVFNVLLLGSFLVAAELFKNMLMTEALARHRPDCVRIHSFVSAIGRGGGSHQGVHAVFTENGKVYLWSYAQRDFFLMPSSDPSYWCQP